MANSCMPQLKPNLYDYPVGRSLLQQLLKFHTPQSQIQGEKSQNLISSKQKTFTTKDIIKCNRSILEDMKPKQSDKMDKNIYKTKVVPSDGSENSATFYAEYCSDGVLPKVESHTITDSDSSTVSAQKFHCEEYKGELKILQKENIYKKTKKKFYLNASAQSSTLVSEITKEIVMTVAKKLETFAFSRKAFSKFTQLSRTQSANLEHIAHKCGCTNRSLLNDGRCESCSVQTLLLNDQQGTLNQLNEGNEMKQIVLKLSQPGLKLSDCIKEILMSILGSILKQLDQNNSLKITNQHMLPLQEGRLLHTLVSSVLNDVSCLGVSDAILTTAIPAIAEKESQVPAISEKENQLQGNLNDQYWPSQIAPDPKLDNLSKSVHDHEKVNKNPSFNTPETVSDAENKQSKATAVVYIPCTLDTDTSNSSEKLSSESSSLHDNSLRDQEVKASKMKIRNIMKKTEYVAHDMLVKILADGEYPVKTDTCKSKNNPFSEKNMFLFVMHNVESILKMLSLAFNYNIVSHVIDVSGVFTSPFMGLCADMKVFKEDLTDKIHEIPNEYTIKLQNIMGMKCPKDGKQKKTGFYVLEELYKLFVQLIMEELELFLTLKSRSNIVKSRKKKGNILKEKDIVKVPVLQIFSNKDIPVTQLKLSEGEKQYSHDLIGTGEVSCTIREAGATTTLVHSKQYIFATTFLHTLLIGIKNSALKEKQKKVSGVITSVSENDGIIRICDLILQAASSEKDFKRESDVMNEKSTNQNASSYSNHNEKESISTASLKASKESSTNMSETSPSPVHTSNDNDSENKMGLCCLKRVSRLSKADAIVCVKKMFPVIKAVKQIVSENLEKIITDIKPMDPCLCKTFDADSLFPVNDVISLTIEITETMLKMLSVAFEQVGVFHGATKGHFIGLCAELRLLKIDIDCHTNFAEVDRSFVNTFSEKTQKQDSLKNATSVITLNEIGQHLVYMISKKFARFIQLHSGHNSGCKKAKNENASDPLCIVSLLPRLHPYAREVSELMFNLINKTLYEEEKKSSPKTAVECADDKMPNIRTQELFKGTTCSDRKDLKHNTAVGIQKLQEPQKAVKHTQHPEDDSKHDSECALIDTLDENNFVDLGYDSKSILKEFQNIATIVFEHAVSKLEEETKTQQSSQVLQMVKQIVNDIFQMYTLNLLLPHIYNTSFNVHISEAILKLATQDTDTFVSKDEIAFLYSDVISIVFEKLHSAFLCATKANGARGCEEYHHPAHGKFTVEQISNPHEQSFKNWLCRQEIFAEMTNNSNNKQGLTFQKSENRINKSSTHCFGITDQFVDGVLQTVTERVESFVAMKVESVFCHANQNTNMSARTFTDAGAVHDSPLPEQHKSQRKIYTTLINNGNVLAETVINMIVKQTSDYTLKVTVSNNSTPHPLTMLNAGTIVEKRKLHMSIHENLWSALSMPACFLFPSSSMIDIITNLVNSIFLLHDNNAACAKMEQMLSDSESSIISTHIRNLVLCNISKLQMYGINNLNKKHCLKSKPNFLKAAESDGRDVLEMYRLPKAMQAAFSAKIEEIVKWISQKIILEMTHHLQPFVPKDLTRRINTTNN